MKEFIAKYRRRIITFMGVFGPATIAAMADNDASGVATYSVAGAKLGYPVLFLLLIITVLLGLTQEMGVRLALVSRKGLGDLIREKYGVRTSLIIFLCLFIANMGTIIVDALAIKAMAGMLGLPAIASVLAILLICFVVVVKGNYRMNQNIMLFACLFFLSYIISAFRSRPDWGLAVSNLFVPNRFPATPEYMRNYLLIGLGVLGTTVTPWGQFFISSFTFDKKLEVKDLKYSQLETYVGAFLTDFFSFFMIVATAATLYAGGIQLVSGEQAALAIAPFVGKLASTVFALGMINAGFMGVMAVALSTAYAFAEFFGLPGGLNLSFNNSKFFYLLFLVQIAIAGVVSIFPSASIFQLAIMLQSLNAMMLPPIMYYLLRLTNDREVMGEHINTPFQRVFAFGGMVVISIASVAVLAMTFMGLG